MRGRMQPTRLFIIVKQKCIRGQEKCMNQEEKWEISEKVGKKIRRPAEGKAERREESGTAANEGKCRAAKRGQKRIIGRRGRAYRSFI